MFDSVLNAHRGMSADSVLHTSGSLGLSAGDLGNLSPETATDKNARLVFVDPTVDNIEQLLSGIDSARVVVLDGEQDGVQQITDTLTQYVHAPLDSVHVISHGDRASLQLGSAVLDAQSLTEYADELTGWQSAIAPDGDILLYGCNVAETSLGRGFVQQFSQLTGADVAASDDLTGLGGDWDLEVNVGAVEAQVILDTITQQQYQGTLETYGDSEYVLTTDAKTWEEAQAEAVAKGGNLVTINDADEYAWLQETFGAKQSFWTGLNDAEQEGEFVWASGEAVTYTNWAPGQPNGGLRGKQDYVRMNFGKQRLWDDVTGRRSLFGIIEIETVVTPPVVIPPVVIPPIDGVFSRVLPVNYSGYNVNAANLGNWDNAETIQTIAKAAKAIGGQTLRVPGGDTANYWDWNVGGIIEDRVPNTEPHNLAAPLSVALRYKRNINASLENVQSFLEGAEADPIWVVNMLTSDLQTEIDHLVEAKRLGMSVDRIELGNEFYFKIPNYTRKDATPLDYAKRAKEWALAIKATPELADSTLAVTGSTSTVRSDRGQTWMAAMTTKTGEDNLSVIDVVDAYTLHPYYKAGELDITKSDVGNTARAGEIARASSAKIRSILAAPALNTAALENEEVWITEHNILEKQFSIVIGNSWLHALMLDFNTQEFLTDERTTASIAHVLIGNPNWGGLIAESGKQISGFLRGKANTPVKTNPEDAFKPTAIGMVLGKTADVLTEGTATLIHSGEASIAWRVQNSEDTISAVNTDDREESLVLPEGQTWQITTYTADPWSTPTSESDLETTTTTLSGGSKLTIAGFSKVIAVAV